MSDFTDKLDALLVAQTAWIRDGDVDCGVDEARAAVVALFDAERARAEAAEKALQGDADKITQSLVDQLAANKRLLDATRAELARVSEALARHGRHDDSCEYLVEAYRECETGAIVMGTNCDCGLEAALKGAGAT